MDTQSRPNIVYIHSHDTGRYVQPYGYRVPTPRIQQLADEGILFRQAFCAAPTCSPSRAALLTGQAAHSAGMTGLAHRGWRLKDYSQHILHTLASAGYHTVLAGLQHLHPDRAHLGFDEIVAPPPRQYGVDAVAPAAARFIQRNHEGPFFIDIGFSETHRDFPEIGPGDDPGGVRPPSPLPDTPETRADMAAYCTMARKLDEGVGIVLDALDEAGIAEQTLVILTTDHGVAFPGCKCSLTDHGMGVMLMLRGTPGLSDGALRGGRVIDGMISQIDLFPTLCDLLEIEHPDWLQGKSMLPILSGDVAEINEEIFAEVSYHAAYEPKRAVRTKRYKYIRRWVAEQTGHRGPVLPNCDDSLSKNVWLENGWSEREIPDEQLYDLVFDPNESRNLAGSPAHREVLEEMQGRLRAWMERTQDPLLEQDGPMPLPENGVVNPIDGTSPRETPGGSVVSR